MNRTGTDLDFSRWAIVSYNDDTGLGRMAQDAKAVLGLSRQIVIPSRRLETKPLGPGDLLLSGETAPLRDFLAELQGLLFLETPAWTPSLLPLARELGLATVGVPMWEWFRAGDPLWKLCGLIACPNQKAFQVVRGCGFLNAVHLPWCLDLARFPTRPVTGPARTFIHNAGLVDADDRKGTRDTIQAFRRVRGNGLRLIVRMQREAALPELDSRIELRIGNAPDPAALYAEGDAAIQPSKLEGIGFMILEPLCSGLPVVTTNIAPMNEAIAEPPLLVRPRWWRRKAFASQWNPQAHLRLPDISDLARKIEWCSDNDLAAISRANRAWAEERLEPGRLREQWRRATEPLLQRHGAAVAEELIPA